MNGIKNTIISIKSKSIREIQEETGVASKPNENDAFQILVLLRSFLCIEHGKNPAELITGYVAE